MKCSICHIVLSLCGKRVPLFFALFYCTFALFLSKWIYDKSEFFEEADGLADFRCSHERGQPRLLQHPVFHLRLAELAVGVLGQAAPHGVLRLSHGCGELHGVLPRHVPAEVRRQGAHRSVPLA